MKITQVKIHNAKAIRDLQVDLEGKHILITADNGIGKTSFLQAIYAGLGIKSMAPHVTTGEKEGEINICTDSGHEFHTEIDKIKGVTKVSVKIPGEKKFDTRVTEVGKIVGELVFNPFDFAELSKTETGRKKQIEIVRELLTDEERATLSKMELQIKANEEARLETGRTLKTMKGAVEAKNISQADIQTYRQYVDVVQLTQEKNAIVEKNKKISEVQSRFEDRAKRIEALESELTELRKHQESATTFLSDNKSESTTELDAMIASASTHNTMVDKVKTYQEEFSKLTKLEEQYGEATSLIESQREALKNAIRSLDLPIPDLTFDDEQLIYQGRAVDNNVMSTSEVMMLGVFIKIAKQPGVKVLIVERAESLGLKRITELVDMADTYGFQILAEQVVRGQEDLRIEFLTEKLKN